MWSYILIVSGDDVTEVIFSFHFKMQKQLPRRIHNFCIKIFLKIILILFVVLYYILSIIHFLIYGVHDKKNLIGIMIGWNKK